MQGVEATLETTKVDISDILPAPSEAMGSLAPPPLWAAIERELRDPNFDMTSYKGVASA